MTSSIYQVNDAMDLHRGRRPARPGQGDCARRRRSLAFDFECNRRRRRKLFRFSFIRRGKVVRNQLLVRCDGVAATLGLGGQLSSLAASMPTRRCSSTTPRGCRSRELFKSVVDGAARGVFQGKIIVRPGAQKTDARMMTRALLLSREAEADNKPELEIFADDVQCGHGATSSALDDNLKFYLMARGIPEPHAEALLIESLSARRSKRSRASAARRANGCGTAVAGDKTLIRAAAAPWSKLDRIETMHPAVTNGTYDVDRVRRDFPILATKVYGRPLIYLDNAASAQKPQAVLDRIPTSTPMNTPMSIGDCIIWPMPRPRPMKAPGKRCAPSLMLRAPKRSSSPATPPRRSTSSPTLMGGSTCKPATRSLCR